MQSFANSAVLFPPEASRLPDMFINFPTPGVWRLLAELSHTSHREISLLQINGNTGEGGNYEKLRAPPLRKCVTTLNGEQCGEEVGGADVTKQMLLLNRHE